jgi:hypothetical protein
MSNTPKFTFKKVQQLIAQINSNPKLTPKAKNMSNTAIKDLRSREESKIKGQNIDKKA